MAEESVGGEEVRRDEAEVSAGGEEVSVDEAESVGGEEESEGTEEEINGGGVAVSLEPIFIEVGRQLFLGCITLTPGAIFTNSSGLPIQLMLSWCGIISMDLVHGVIASWIGLMNASLTTWSTALNTTLSGIVHGILTMRVALRTWGSVGEMFW